MEIIFAKNYLKELYMEGKSSDKKHRYQKDIIKRYRKTIDRMVDAKRTEDLMLINSLRYEKLIGLRSGISSVRVQTNIALNLKRELSKEQIP